MTLLRGSGALLAVTLTSVIACGEAFVDPVATSVPAAGAGTGGASGGSNTAGGESGASDCPSPAFALCSGRCVHVLMDDDHCGACDTPCPDGRQCAASVCQPIEP